MKCILNKISGALLLFILFGGSVAANEEDLIISSVIVEGIPEELKAELGYKYIEETRQGKALNREKIEQDARRIYDTGYFQNVKAVMRSAPEGVVVVFELSPNPTIKEVKFHGLTQVDEHEILGQMESRPGTIINTSIIEQDAERVHDWFVQMGYPLGRFVRYWLDESSALHFQVDEGRIESIRFKGLQRVSEDELRKLISIKEGSILQEADIKHSMEALLRHPRVGEVEAGVSQGEHGAVITFQVQEQKTGEYTIGAGYNTRDGFLALGSISDTDFLRTGRTIGADFRISQRTKQYSLNYVDPTLCSCWESLRLRLYHESEKIHREDKSIQQEQTGVSLAITKALTKNLKATLGSTYKTFLRNEMNNAKRIVSVDGGLEYQFDRGKWRLNSQFSTPSLGSDYSFAKVSANHIHRIPLEKHEISIATQLGTSFGKSSLPSIERYLVGGFGTLRGHSYGKYEGDHMIATTIEFRYRIFEPFSLAAFVDLADAWETGRTPEFKSSWGIGGRIDTPIGVLQLDLATNEHDKIVFVFGIGTEW